MGNQEIKKKRGLARLTAAFGYSQHGLIATYKHEAAFRQELFGLIIAIPLALIIAESLIEVALLIGVILLVLVVELLNSALESVVDRLGSEHHVLSGRAKDQGSAAVMITLILAAILWAAVILN